MITNITDDTIVTAIARACHDVNNAFRVAMGQKPKQLWTLYPQAEKEIVKQGVYKALSGATPEQMHENWTKDKLNAGWKYGPVLNTTTKEHPCLVRYSELPSYERAKDELFIRVVRAMVDAVETGKQL